MSYAQKVFSLYLVLTAFFSIPVFAQAETDAKVDIAALEQLQSEVDVGFAQVQTLTEAMEAVSEYNREAIMFRRDERGFEVLQKLDRLATGAAQLPEDDPLRESIRLRLENDFGTLPGSLFQQISDLGDRIEALYTEKDSLSGTSLLAMEAYIYSLESMRIQSYGSAVNLLNGRKALNLPVEDISPKLIAQLTLHAEALAGRLNFSGAAGNELKSRLGLDPTNAELASATKSFDAMHAYHVERLGMISELLAKLGLNNKQYEATLLQQGRDFSVTDLDRDVLGSLIKDARHELKTYVDEQAPDFVFSLVVFVIILLIFRWLSRLTRRAVIAACERSGLDMSVLLKDVLASVSSGTVMVIGVLIALSQVGISLGPMLAGLGVAGFIVGFALQDTLGNFAAGSMILIYRPYDVDDFIEVAGASGLVKKMSLVSTTITTFDNQTLVVPNSKIWGDVIKNVTAQRIRRVDLEFGIGYGDDVEKAERVLHDIIEAHELVLKKPAPLIRLHALADSSVNFVVRPWVKTEDYWDVYWDITREVKLRFDREEISIPFPQQDVHIHSAPS